MSKVDKDGSLVEVNVDPRLDIDASADVDVEKVVVILEESIGLKNMYVHILYLY
jgi:hypothetical protein